MHEWSSGACLHIVDATDGRRHRRFRISQVILGPFRNRASKFARAEGKRIHRRRCFRKGGVSQDLLAVAQQREPPNLDLDRDPEPLSSLISSQIHSLLSIGGLELALVVENESHRACAALAQQVDFQPPSVGLRGGQTERNISLGTDREGTNSPGIIYRLTILQFEVLIRRSRTPGDADRPPKSAHKCSNLERVAPATSCRKYR